MADFDAQREIGGVFDVYAGQHGAPKHNWHKTSGLSVEILTRILDMKKQAKLSDVRLALETAVDAITQIELRAEDSRPELSFEQRIIEACRAMDNGDPLKDYLDRDDIEQAIKTLGDIYTVTGVTMPPDWN